MAMYKSTNHNVYEDCRRMFLHHAAADQNTPRTLEAELHFAQCGHTAVGCTHLLLAFAEQAQHKTRSTHALDGPTNKRSAAS